MITKSDTYVLLSYIQEAGIDISEQLKLITNQLFVPESVIKFINKNRALDLTNFYTNLRKNYNHKHSKLYGNIVKEITEPKIVLTTLTSLLTQILIFSETVENKEMFLRHARAEEISKALAMYFSDYNIEICCRLLRVIKADLKCLETE